MTPSRRSTPLIAVLIALGLIGSTSPASPPMVATADDHVWVVATIEPIGSTPRLIHHHPSMLGIPLREVAPLSAMPTGIAAWGDRVWMLFAPGGDGADSDDPSRLETLSVRAVPNPVRGSFDSDPPGRLELLPSLRGSTIAPRGRIRGVDADVDGPVVFFEEESTLIVAALGGSGWFVRERIALPEAEPLGVATFGSDGRSIAVLGRRQAGTGADALVLWRRTPGDAWRAWPLSTDTDGHIDAASLAVQRWGDGLLVVARSDAELRLWHPTAAGAVEVGRLEAPVAGGLVAVGPRRSGLVAIELRPAASTARESVALFRIDPESGRRGPDLIATAGASGRSRYIHVPILGAVATMVAMTVLIVRGDGVGRSVALRSGWEAARPSRRVLALAIDFAPAALLTHLIHGSSLVELIALPIWTVPWALAVPSLTALALHAIIVGISEALRGASVGKRLVGLRVACIDDGTTLRGRRPLVRSMVRLVVLALPILAIFHVLGAQWRGLPEQAAKAIVVARRRR